MTKSRVIFMSVRKVMGNIEDKQELQDQKWTDAAGRRLAEGYPARLRALSASLSFEPARALRSMA